MRKDVSGELPETEDQKKAIYIQRFSLQKETPSSKGFTGHAFPIRAKKGELFRKHEQIKTNRHKKPTQAVALVETKAAAQETREGIAIGKDY